MNKSQMLLVLAVVLLTNLGTAFGTGMFCYNYGWNEALAFCTENHVRALEDMRKEGR